MTRTSRLCGQRGSLERNHFSERNHILREREPLWGTCVSHIRTLAQHTYIYKFLQFREISRPVGALARDQNGAFSLFCPGTNPILVVFSHIGASCLGCALHFAQ